MPDQYLEVEEQLLQGIWQIHSIRERLLELAEELPEPDRERVHQSAEKLTVFCAQIRKIVANLPDPEDDAQQRAAKSSIDLRALLERALQDGLESVRATLLEIAGDPDEEEEETPDLLN